MAKGNSKSTKSASVKVVNRGGGSIADQIAKLEKTMTAEQVKEARVLASDPTKRDVLKLAFRLTPKASTRALVLSTREQAEKARIVKLLGVDAGDSWERGVLREKGEKRKAS